MRAGDQAFLPSTMFNTTCLARGFNTVAGSILGVALGGLATATVLGAQTSPTALQEEFSSEERVTVVEVQVEAPDALFGRLKRATEPADVGLMARVGGDSAEVIALSLPRIEELPWSQLIYFDVPLSSPGAISWAAKLLAPRVEELVELGPIQIVIADPIPRVLLGPTRDSDAIDLALSGLALNDPGEGLLSALRREFLDALTELESESSEAAETPGGSSRLEELLELSEAIWAEETRLVTAGQDTLLETISGSLIPLDRSSSRRLLYWVSSGFDLNAEEAYGLLIDDSKLNRETEQFTQSLAAFGWSVIPLLRPEPKAPLLPGIRIGKLRITGVGATRAGDPAKPDGPFMPTISATWEEDRDPDRARAFYELALALVEEGRLKRAEDSFRDALRFFHGDPRTRDEQAAAWEGLASVLDQLDRPEEARRAFEQVARLRSSESTVEELPPPPTTDPETEVYNSRLRSPERPLEAVAETTAGKLVRSDESLGEAIDRLDERFLVSLQLSGLPDGKTYPLSLTIEGSPRTLNYPSWLRRGTPERVAEARIRLLLEETLAPEGTGLPVGIDSLERLEDRLKMSLSTDGYGAEGGQHRVTLGLVDDQGHLTAHHFVLSVVEGSMLTEIPIGPNDGLVIALVEDLISGDWGATVEDLPGVR